MRIALYGLIFMTALLTLLTAWIENRPEPDPPAPAVAPPPVVAQGCDVELTLDSRTSRGYVFSPTSDGRFTFSIAGGAYSNRPTDTDPRGVGSWGTRIVGYKNDDWKQVWSGYRGVNMNMEIAALDIGRSGFTTEEEAENQTKGLGRELLLGEGETITLTVYDQRARLAEDQFSDAFKDNRGTINVRVKSDQGACIR
ncbi:MAG: hypothetical protein WKH64_08560 [Chloroflexia bacterium]